VFTGNLIDALTAYDQGALGPQVIPLSEVDQLLVIGSDRMMAAVQSLWNKGLGDLPKPGCHGFASVNAPMQCMMKGICAQCLQRHVDPQTGAETFVYSCAFQDQPLDCVDFPFLRRRLSQNTAQEKLGDLWVQTLSGEPKRQLPI
jgi:hypothetical protein